MEVGAIGSSNYAAIRSTLNSAQTQNPNAPPADATTSSGQNQSSSEVIVEISSIT